MNIAVIETKINRNQYDFSFDFERFQLCSNTSIKKVLKADVDIEIDTDEYDWVILIGADALKYFTKQTAVTQYTGRLIDKKYIAMVNPAAISFNPAVQKVWDESVESAENIIAGRIEAIDFDSCVEGITDKKRALEYIQEAIDWAEDDYVGLDSETSALYPRDGYILGISLCYRPDFGAYIDAMIIDEEVEEKLQELCNKKLIVFHNAKFDLKFFEYHFNITFPKFHDTMLMHYILDELNRHGLKYLAIRYTLWGDYERDLEEWKKDYCRTNKVKVADFTYDVIPFETMFPYASIDAIVTFQLFAIFRKSLNQNKKLKRVYNSLMLPACRMLTDIEQNGIPFDKERLLKSEKLMDEDIALAVAKLYEFPEIKKFEEDNKDTIKDGIFNPNSVKQLRQLLFDYLGLKPTGKKTGKGEHSTDADVLKELGLNHPIPKLILEIRQKGKIKNTYLSKIIPELDLDSRLRTNFNQHVTTSGRLSSSGKLNAQQLPRDNPIVKGCIRAREGYKIISMDLKTAEMYYAAVLSEDKNLIAIFQSGENFHSSVAKDVFNLDCEVEEVEHLHSKYRNATKAINFGIIYGAQGFTISASILSDTGVYISPAECNEYIRIYFRRFPQLKKWIKSTQRFIADNAFIYSHFGRKRRLPKANSDNKGERAHEIRSGLNFVIQSLASDINVLGAIDIQNWISAEKKDIKLFALVHDSILAEVKDELIEEYVKKLTDYIQKDRGVAMQNCPIGCDFEIGEDYSFGKFTNKYPEAA